MDIKKSIAQKLAWANPKRKKFNEYNLKHPKYWTKNQIYMLKEEYNKNYVNLTNLSKILSKSNTGISRKARELGLLTKYSRKKPPEIILKYTKYPEKYDFIKLNYGKIPNKELAKVTGYSISGLEKIANSYRLKKEYQIWEKNEHPRGFLGHNHTIQSKKKISEKSILAWENPGSKFNSPGHRQFLSDMATKLQAEGRFATRYSFTKRGYRKDLQKFFRSSWEANYARYLNFLVKNNKILKWEYEPDILWFEKIKRGIRSYTPDFKITNIDNTIEYHEVKGWMDKKSKTKLKRTAKYYPNIKMILIDKTYYNKLKKQLRGLIPNWE